MMSGSLQSSVCSKWQKRQDSPCLQPVLVVKWMQGVHFLAALVSGQIDSSSENSSGPVLGSPMNVIQRYNMPRTHLTSIFEGQPPKTRPKFQSKQRSSYARVCVWGLVTMMIRDALTLHSLRHFNRASRVVGAASRPRIPQPRWNESNNEQQVLSSCPPSTLPLGHVPPQK